MAETNKEIAIRFLEMASSGQVREAYSRFVDPGFKHHNAFFEGSASSLMTAMEESTHQYPDKSLEVKHAIAEGDFVFVHAHVQHQPGEPGAAVMHLFRFEHGRIVEPWDIGQAVPQASPNQYGMF